MPKWPIWDRSQNGLFHDMRPIWEPYLEAYMSILTCMHAQRVSGTGPEVSRMGPILDIRS